VVSLKRRIRTIVPSKIDEKIAFFPEVNLQVALNTFKTTPDHDYRRNFAFWAGVCIPNYNNARASIMSHVDVKAAKTNPSKYFASPQDVLCHTGLSREAKIEILRQWEVDARLMSVAEEENMTDGEHSHLGAVVSALIALDDERKHSTNDTGSGAGKAGG